MSQWPRNPKPFHLVIHVYQHKLLSQNQMDDKSLFLVLGCDHASVVKSSYKIHMAEGSRDIMELYFYHQQWKALLSEQLLSKLYISALLAHRGAQNGCWCKFWMLTEAIHLKLTIKNMISFCFVSFKVNNTDSGQMDDVRVGPWP